MKRVAMLTSILLIAGCGAPVEESGQQGLTTTPQDAGAPDAGTECAPNTEDACPEMCTTVGQVSYPDGGGQTFTVCGSKSCDATGHWGPCQPPNTPLVLVFDGAPVQFSHGASASFDLAGAGREVAVDWPSARTPWLALDVDHDGRIDDGRELFGSMTRLPDGRRARNGFEALAALDANRDGRIDARDPAWKQLLVWADGNSDRRSEPRELTTVAERGLISIELAYRVEPRCTARGDCEVERARFSWRDGAGNVRTGEVVDVHLAEQRLPLACR